MRRPPAKMSFERVIYPCTAFDQVYMSRLSEYDDAQILDIIHENGYRRLSGKHRNGASIHVLLHECGMINEKSSKTLLSKKRGCNFIPCRKRGLLSLLYVRSVAAEHGVDYVGHPHENKLPLERLAIAANDTLVWRKGSQTMSQSWKDVRTRALSQKTGVFFQPDATRRALPSRVLTMDDLNEICASRQLIPPSSVPARRAKQAVYVHAPCKGEVVLRFVQLLEWDESRCTHCYPHAERALQAFRTFLQDAEMTFSGSLKMKEKGKQVDRSQSLQIECQFCEGVNAGRTYDLIRYRGFVYCDNLRCQNTYAAEDQVGRTDDYYIKLLKDADIKFFADAQRLFPRAMRYLMRPEQIRPANESTPLGRYARIRDALGLDANAPTSDFSDDELERAFRRAINDGCENISQLRSSLDNEVNNFINRCVAGGDKVHHRILKKMGFRFKHGYNICSVADAIDCVTDTGCESWSAFVTRYPEASATVIDLGFKEPVMAEFGWRPLVNYSEKSDDELLNVASTIFTENRFTSMSQMEAEYSSLIGNLRSRRLIDGLYEILGLEKAVTWQGMSFEDLISHVRGKAYTSFSNWHNESSGSYKYAASCGWVRDVGKEMNWGIYQGLDGYMYGSLPETIVANLLYLTECSFVSHPRIDHFSGYGGGRPFADFLINNDLWVEVWAYRIDDTPAGAFAKYPEVRRHKEAGYKKNGMRLCDIEGGLFYRKYVIDDIKYPAGLSNFVRHVCKRLTLHGYPTEYTAELLSLIRKSVVNESDSAMIER